MIPVIRSGLFGIALAMSPAFAQHAPHRHADGPHGGRVEEAGPWHAELVTATDDVSVHLSDEAGRPMGVAGFKGTAILISGGKPVRILLAPEGDRLAGHADTPLDDRPKGAVRLAAPDGVTASARFE